MSHRSSSSTPAATATVGSAGASSGGLFGSTTNGPLSRPHKTPKFESPPSRSNCLRFGSSSSGGLFGSGSGGSGLFGGSASSGGLFSGHGLILKNLFLLVNFSDLSQALPSASRMRIHRSHRLAVSELLRPICWCGAVLKLVDDSRCSRCHMAGKNKTHVDM